MYKLALTRRDRVVLWAREYGQLVFWLLVWPLVTGSTALYLINYHPEVGAWVHAVLIGTLPIAKLLAMSNRRLRR